MRNFIICWLSIGFLISCNNGSKPEQKSTQAEIDSLEREKTEMTERLQKQKKRIDDRIAELRMEQAQQTEKKARDFYDESIERLNRSSDSLDAKMDRFEKETSKDWQHLKKEMNEAFDSAEKELNDVGEAIKDFFRKDDHEKKK